MVRLGGGREVGLGEYLGSGKVGGLACEVGLGECLRSGALPSISWGEFIDMAVLFLYPLIF